MRQFLSRLSDLDRNDLTQMVSNLSDFRRPDETSYLQRIGQTARSVGNRSGRVARRTQHYIADHPRASAGIGVGTVAVAALGTLVYLKMKKASEANEKIEAAE